MDTLSDVLALMRLKSCVYFQREFAAPWGMEMPDGPCAQFHMVARGRCRLRFNGATIELAGGDVVMFPGGKGH
ncbi:MAG TPA: AraC family transcriptional regulator, partial [Rhodospirillales bacterium]|nr:AraC family transcriptional regulator [Rhodospirillales bacterium]